ncbi:MAG: hypothetical protein ACREFE_04880 [Limisphaerales bacterium]
MTHSEAQKEFKIRYYLWSISEFETEITSSFPNLRLFKTGAVWALHQFMQQLDRNNQIVLAHSLLKRFHSDAVKALAESCSNEEKSLRDQLDDFRRKSGVDEVNNQEKERKQKKRKFVSKRKLQKVIAEKFREAYGSQMVKMPIGEGLESSDPFFYTSGGGGWVIYTQFWFVWFGCRVIGYNHCIQSEAIKIHRPDNSNIPDAIKKSKQFKPLVEHLAQKPEFKVPVLTLAQQISFGSWLGITSQMQWQYLTEEDVEPVCSAVIKFCGRFFDVAPKLLKGLEFDKITP